MDTQQGGSPAIDPLFGPTRPAPYWSSTQRPTNPLGALAVYFDQGNVSDDQTTVYYSVRAVRGGP